LIKADANIPQSPLTIRAFAQPNDLQRATAWQALRQELSRDGLLAPRVGRGPSLSYRCPGVRYAAAASV